ncbi:HAMP domain-containing histidine kinase [Streptomyces sp. SJ1-7]|nr:HAMP domain-containing histidine kinase [Streptomyces sp. SJ1-7]
MIVFGGVLAVSATLLIVLVVVLMAYVPTYTLTPADVTFVPGEAPPPPRPSKVPVALSSPSDFLLLLVVSSSLALPLVIVIGSLLMRMVVGRALAPLSEIDAAARSAVAGDLGSRVDVDGPPDEVTGLAHTFNTMLARLQRSFATQREFAANASHELQTPLATGQALIDVALGDPNLRPVHDLLNDLRQLSTRSTRTVTALLDLAAAQEGSLDRQTVALDAAVRRAVEEHRPQAAAADVQLRFAVPPPVCVSADPVLLRLMLDNLVGNAIQHNTRPGTVDVALMVDDERATFSIVNSGPVLSPVQAAQVGQPFYRAHGRTVRATGGTGRGLGAALVARIAEGHDWSLHVTARPDGGLRATVGMKRDPTPSQPVTVCRTGERDTGPGDDCARNDRPLNLAKDDAVPSRP